MCGFLENMLNTMCLGQFALIVEFAVFTQFALFVELQNSNECWAMSVFYIFKYSKNPIFNQLNQ